MKGSLTGQGLTVWQAVSEAVYGLPRWISWAPSQAGSMSRCHCFSILQVWKLRPQKVRLEPKSACELLSTYYGSLTLIWWCDITGNKMKLELGTWRTRVWLTCQASLRLWVQYFSTPRGRDLDFRFVTASLSVWMGPLLITPRIHFPPYQMDITQSTQCTSQGMERDYLRSICGTVWKIVKPSVNTRGKTTTHN
jgi:hypothetical protein